ncbi:MAG TPA: hypothetical protein VF605_19940 [Allosphingosinicella sp.]|jgi:hypothetical protein
MIRVSAPFAALLLLAACGGDEEDIEPRANSQEELENRLDKLADRISEDIEPPARLGDLVETDVGPELRSEPACRVRRNGRLILVVNAAGAVARIDDRRVPLSVSGPIGPTGGFLTAPGVTVSVGRLDAPVAGADEHGREWRARITIGGDKERPIEKHEATWICSR